jgi:hypothetical protein
VNARKEFDKQQNERALEGFRASYNIVASPNTLLMVGRTLVALDRLEDAYAVLDETVSIASQASLRDPKYKETEQAALVELESLRKSVVAVTFSVVGATDDTVVFLQGRQVDREQWGKGIPLRMGNATLTVTAAGKPGFVHVLAVGVDPPFYVVDLESYWAAPVKEVVVQEKTNDNSKKGEFLGLDMRKWSYVAGGVGVAGAVTYGVFGAMNLAKHSKIEDNCPNMRCPAGSDYSSDVDAGRRNKHIANVGFAVGIAGLATGATLFVLSIDSKQDSAKSTKTIVPAQVAIGAGSITVGGTF